MAHHSRSRCPRQDEGLLHPSQDSFGTNGHLTTNLGYLKVYLRKANAPAGLVK
ncbi:uncharacterized protein METZ01_LOCUS149433 [marine metagenome]|uniref:Uncharacterized protein n=1 Tax=marine metagenome TaxID=408172 RepID=A0A382A5C9_9ZZZZ